MTDVCPIAWTLAAARVPTERGCLTPQGVTTAALLLVAQGSALACIPLCADAHGRPTGAVVWGAADAYIPREMADKQQRSFPSAQIQ